MKLRMLLWILCVSLLYVNVDTYNETHLASRFAEHVSYTVTIVIKSSEKLLSLVASYIIQEIIKEFPTIIINPKGLTALADKKMQVVQDFSTSEFQENILKIIFLDTINKNTTQELVDSINLLMNFTSTSFPSKCAVILVNSSNNTDFQQFFRFSWKTKLLHITLIELPQRKGYGNYFFSNNDGLQIIVHQYNPFNNSYSREPFSSIIQIFPDKLHNLHGFPLTTGIFEQFPAVVVNPNYNGSNILDAIHGIDVEIIKTMSRTINFSLNVKAVESQMKHLKKFNATIRSINEEIEAGRMDFSFNLLSVVGHRSSLRTNRLGTFLYPYSYSILIKQYGTYRINIPLYTIFSVLLTISIIVVLVFVLQFNVKVWTLNNITKILTGGSITPEPQKLSERIFFMCLTFAYFVFSVKIIGRLLHLYLYQKSYLQLTSLSELKNASIVPYMVSHSKQMIIHSNDSYLIKIAKDSESLATYGDIDDCVSNLLNKEVRSVNGCQILSILGDEIEDSFVDNKGERLISLVEEPLAPAWAALLHAPMSHYVGRFDDVMRRLYEAGLIRHWIEDITKDYLISLQANFTTGQHLQNQDEDTEEKWSVQKIMFKLAICYCFSCLIFLGEVVWSRVRIRSVRRQTRNHIRVH